MSTKIPLRVVDAPDAAKFDIIVVGGGLSGMTSAYSAARAGPGRHTLILEAGPLGPYEHLDSQNGQDTAFSRWCMQVPDNYAPADVEQSKEWSGISRRVAGGRGLYWGGVLCRINPAEFTGDAAASGWLRSQGLQSGGAGYADVIDRLSVLDFYKPGGRRLPDSPPNLAFTSIARAAGPSGYPIFSPLHYFQLTTARSTNLHLATEVDVKAVHRNHDHFTVEYETTDGRHLVFARSLILAAGLVENCRLFETCLQTGQAYQFTEHLVSGVAAFLPAGFGAEQLLSQAGGEVFFLDRAAERGFNLFLSSSPRLGGWVLDVWAMGEKDLESPLELRTDGVRVTISGRKSRNDLAKEAAMLATVQAALEELWPAYGGGIELKASDEVTSTKSAMRRVHFEDCPAGLSIAYVSELGSVDHDACIRNPAFELDGIGRVPRSDLFVVGPGALKRMGSANPNFAALSLAGRVGEAAAATE